MKEYETKLKAEWEDTEGVNEGHKLGVVVHTCDPSSQKAETEGAQVLGHTRPLKTWGKTGLRS